jgi:hypothetical protein
MSRRQAEKFLLVVSAVGLLAAAMVLPARAALKKWAVVVPASNKLEEVSLANIVQLCKGQKPWTDGKNFTLVMHDPETPEMRTAVQVLFGVAPGEMKVLLANVNQSRVVVKIVDNDDDLLRTVVATPGAVGLIDVYAINSSVRVLRIDGKLPFDAGYAFKTN